MNARDNTLPLRSLIAQHLDSVEDATANQIARAVGLKDYPSRVIAELNAMRADALIECEQRGKTKELSYWLSVPAAQILNAAQPEPAIAPLPAPADLPEGVRPGTRGHQIWDALAGDRELTARQLALALNCAPGALDPLISALYKTGTIHRTKRADGVFRYHRPRAAQHQTEQPQPEVGQNTGSNGSGPPSEHHLLPEAVAVHEKPAAEALASSLSELSAAADVTDDGEDLIREARQISCGSDDDHDDEPMPTADPAMLAAANRMLQARLDGVAHALRGSGLPGLANVTGSEDLQPHVAALTGAYQIAISGVIDESIERAAEHLAEAMTTVTGVEAEVIDGMCLEALAEQSASELRNLRALTNKLEEVLHSKHHECEGLRAQLTGRAPGLEGAEPAGYIMTASKRKPRRITIPERARDAAIAAIRAGAQRAEVYALVPIGRAVRGAEWRDA